MKKTNIYDVIEIVNKGRWEDLVETLENIDNRGVRMMIPHPEELCFTNRSELCKRLRPSSYYSFNGVDEYYIVDEKTIADAIAYASKKHFGKVGRFRVKYDPETKKFVSIPRDYDEPYRYIISYDWAIKVTWQTQYLPSAWSAERCKDPVYL